VKEWLLETLRDPAPEGEKKLYLANYLLAGEINTDD
jgi:hypothetical protein